MAGRASLTYIGIWTPNAVVSCSVVRDYSPTRYRLGYAARLLVALGCGGEPKSQKIARALHERSCNSTSDRATSHQSDSSLLIFNI